MKLTISDIFEIPSAVIYEPDKFNYVSSVTIDTRKVKKNSLFVAIKGQRFDGHDFVEDAINKGASAIVINKRKLRKFDNVDIPIICVDDTVKALGDLASIWRKKLKAKVISITGSNGKTTVKDMIAILFAEKFKIIATESNNNNHIGVPLTIFSANERTEYLILEHGTNHFGEIKYTAEIANPDYALITNIGDSHLEYLKDRAGVLNEKSALFLAAIQNNGKLFINNDDKLLRDYSKKIKALKITFGFKGSPDVKGKILGYDDYARPLISVQDKRRKLKIKLPLVGESNAKNVLAAIAVAGEAGMTKSEILKGIAKLKAPKGRLNIIESGSKILIDDTYNANPNSLRAALMVLKRIKKWKRKVLILGDMFELGKNSKEIHKSLSGDIKKVKNLELYCIGSGTKALAKELKNDMATRHFVNREVLKKYLHKNDFSESVVLVKGSRGMKMEEFLEVLKEND